MVWRAGRSERLRAQGGWEEASTLGCGLHTPKPHLKVNSDSGLQVVVKCAISKAKQQRGLSNSSVTNKQEF